MQARQIPNLISAARLASVPCLLWVAAGGWHDVFAWLLLAAGASDLLDGWLARRFGWVSRFGAMLDSIADVMLTLTAIIGLWLFHRVTLADYWPFIAAICVTWLLVHAFALFRYGRLASFHTRLTQVGLLSFGFFVLLVFFHGFVPWFFYSVAAVCTLAGIENFIMIAMLPKWTPNTRGGLLALLKERAAT
jgi:CDP-diacylglycerol--glycerol-3-phosphate 3-phosphatidyltransferase